MGTEENDSEPAAQQLLKEQGSTEKETESAVEHPQGQTSEDTDPLDTYKWHTGSKGTLDEVKGEGEGGGTASAASTIVQKISSNKWSKMQSWRKALSEDTGVKSSPGGKGGEGTKAEKVSSIRKNPFRRALSEPPGSLFSSLSPSSSSATAASSSAPAEASGVSGTEPAQKAGGGTLFKKCLWTVSQKLKRPKLQSRNSARSLLPGEVSKCTQLHYLKALQG